MADLVLVKYVDLLKELLHKQEFLLFLQLIRLQLGPTVWEHQVKDQGSSLVFQRV